MKTAHLRFMRLPKGIAAMMCVFMSTVCAAPAEQLTVIPADTANKEAYVTNKGINWYTSLDKAEQQARKEGKLVFWLHMLGTIDGAT